ncbi:transposase family protein [Microcoleus sp. AT9_B5]
MAACPRCSQISHRLHQNKSHLVRDLPMADREVILKVNRRRFKCENCQKPFSKTLYFVGNKKFILIDTPKLLVRKLSIATRAM